MHPRVPEAIDRSAPGQASQLKIIALFPFDNPVHCPLPDWTAIRVSGADAAAFLHGQFTNDVSGLAIGHAQWNGWCSPKGRLIATFALLRLDADAFLVALPADVAPGFVKRLRMFVLRSKVVVEPLEGTHRLIGTTASADCAGGAGVAIDVFDLPDGRRILCCPAESTALVEEALSETALAADPVAWEQIAIRHGVATITVPTQDRFVPQMLNWELVGGVNFQKGCYPGQEIVARMQYLGKLKERLHRAHVDVRHVADGVPVPGQPLYGATFGQQSCGTVVNVAPTPDGEGYDLLAVIQVASAADDIIRLGPSVDAPVLRLESLPYPVPSGKAA